MNDSKTYDLGVVILNYNGLTFLEKFLPLLKKNSPEYANIYVIDNQSTDASRSYLRKNHSEVTVITLEKNLGYAGGYNAGLAQVEHKFLFLVNSDIELSENCIELLMERIITEPNCAAIQPKVRSYKEKEFYEYAGAAGGFIDNLGYPFCRGRVFETLEEDKGQYDDSIEIFWATGAAMLIRNEVFQALGGFDEYFFAHQEEIDLCWQIKRAGFKILVEPQATVYHVGGGTLSYDNPKKTYLNFRNNLFMIIKNEPKRRLLWILPFRLILDGIAAIHFLTQGKFKHFQAILNAHFSLYGNIGLLKNKRRKARHNILQLKQSLSEATIVTGRINKSIIVDYFLKGKKTYNEIIK